MKKPLPLLLLALFCFHTYGNPEADPLAATIHDAALKGKPFFEPPSARAGDEVTLVVPLEKDGAIASAMAFTKNDMTGETIGVHDLRYDRNRGAWTGTMTVGKHFPTGINWDRIAVYDKERRTRSFSPGKDFEKTAPLAITGTTPDGTGPVLLSAEFSRTNASAGDTVFLYAVFDDPETGIARSWNSSIQVVNRTRNRFQSLDWRYDAAKGRYYGSWKITDDPPAEFAVSTLWAKNGVGATVRLRAGEDFTSPVLKIVPPRERDPDRAEAPSFTPPAGTYDMAQGVRIATGTAGASIRYTTDGTAPTASSPLYTGPVTVSATTTLKAAAWKEGWSISTTGNAVYRMEPSGRSPTIQDALLKGRPFFEPPAAAAGDTVTLVVVLENGGAVIGVSADLESMEGIPLRFEKGRGAWTGALKIGRHFPTSVAWDGISVSDGNGRRRVLAPGQDFPKPDPLELSGTAPDVTGPVLTALEWSRPKASVGDTVHVHARFDDPESGIRHSVGSTIRISDRAGTAEREIGGSYDGAKGMFDGSLRITADLPAELVVSTLWATNGLGTRVRLQEGKDFSSPVLRIAPLAPSFTPPAGTYDMAQGVRIATGTWGSSIRYTTDGTDPTASSPLYAGPLTVSAATTIKAIALKEGWADSEAGSAAYEIVPSGRAPVLQDVVLKGTPFFEPPAAKEGDTVTLVAAFENGGAITNCYTFLENGMCGEAIEGVSLRYDKDRNAWTGTLKVEKHFPTSVVWDQINVGGKDGKSRYLRAGADYPKADPLAVTGTAPDTTGPVLQSLDFSRSNASVGDTVNVYAVFVDPESGIKRNWSSYSQVSDRGRKKSWSVSWSYDGVRGRYQGSLQITDDLPSELIVSSLWAKNGAGITASPQEGKDFASPVLRIVPPSEREPDKTAAPSFTPPAGTYDMVQSVTIATETPGASIRYTTDGTDPTASSPLYTWPVTVSAATVVKAVALKEGWTGSQTAGAAYAIVPSGRAPAIQDTVLKGKPFFEPPTAKAGDVVTLVVAFENAGAVTSVSTYVRNDPSGETIDSVGLRYDQKRDAWTGTLKIEKYFPAGISWSRISVYDKDWKYRGFSLGYDHPKADPLVITGTAPDTSGPVLKSVEWSRTDASVGDTVNIHAVFEDPESGIKRYWGSSIQVADREKKKTWSVNWSSNGADGKYSGSLKITDDLPSELIVSSLWAKNGAGITVNPQEGKDFASPVLSIGGR